MFIFDIFTQAEPDGSLGATLAGVVEGIPHRPSRVTEMGLYTMDSLLGTVAAFDVTETAIELVQSTERGSAKSFVEADPRNMVHFAATHLSKSAKITEADVRDVRALGSAQFEAAKSALLRKLRKPVNNVRATLEFHRLGGIRNMILDADGNPIPGGNMYAKFGVNGGVAPAPKYLDLDNMPATGFPFRDFCGEIVDEMADALGGLGFEHAHCFVTNGDMRKIAALPECERAFERQQDGAKLREGYGYSTVFEYGGVVFETYRGKVGGVDFVSPGEMVFFPVGADNFWQGFAPATRIIDPITGEAFEGGRIGQPEFVLPSQDTTNGEWEAVEIQSNPMTVNLRPLSTIIANTGAAPAP